MSSPSLINVTSPRTALAPALSPSGSHRKQADETLEKSDCRVPCPTCNIGAVFYKFRSCVPFKSSLWIELLKRQLVELQYNLFRASCVRQGLILSETLWADCSNERKEPSVLRVQQSGHNRGDPLPDIVAELLHLHPSTSKGHTRDMRGAASTLHYRKKDRVGL